MVRESTSAYLGSHHSSNTLQCFTMILPNTYWPLQPLTLQDWPSDTPNSQQKRTPLLTLLASPLSSTPLFPLTDSFTQQLFISLTTPLFLS